MKIYNKKTFVLGLLTSALLLFHIITGVQKGFEYNQVFLCVLLLFFSIRFIVRSLSLAYAKEDKLKERDERNQMIRLKARSRAMMIAEILMLCSALFFFYLARIPSNGNDPAMIGFGFLGACFITMLAEFGTILYYEHRM